MPTSTAAPTAEHRGRIDAGDLTALAHDVAEHGPTPFADRLASLAADGLALGVTPILLTIVTDSTAPDVVRQRAFGRIVAELAVL